MTAPLDLSGRRFDRLVAVRRAGSNAHGQALWLCSCLCGGQVMVVAAKLMSGHTRSCGCIKVERFRKLGLRPKRRPRPKCAAPGCDRPAREVSGPHCEKHLMRLKRYGRLHLIRRENGTGWMAKKYIQVSIKSRRTYEHIVVAERALGKPLPNGAVVHHVNLDTHDNRPCNLVICPDEAYHRLLHKRMRERGWYDELRPEFRHVA